MALGTGVSRFEPFIDGAELPLDAGIQGGFHVWLSVRIDELPPGPFFFDLEMARVDGGIPPEGSSPFLVSFREPNGGGSDLPPASAELIGWPAAFARAWCFVGEATRATLRVVEGDGDDWAEAERTFIPVEGVTPLPDRNCPERE